MISKIKSVTSTFGLYIVWCFIEILSFIGSLVPNHSRNEKCALVLAFSLPPASNSGTHRPLSFLKYASNSGWKISAISDLILDADITDAGRYLEQQIPDNVEIKRFNKLFSSTSWLLTPQVDGGFINAISLVIFTLKMAIRRDFDTLIVSGPPFYFAIAGFYLSKLSNTRLVLDYRDEWTLCPFEFVSKSRWDDFFEFRCLKRASLVVYTTKSHMVHHISKYPFIDGKQLVVANGWEDAIRENSVSSNIINKSEVLNISYIGKLSLHADPKLFLDLVKKITDQYPELKSRIAINFIGPKHPSMEKLLSRYQGVCGIVNSIGEVPRNEALKMMEESDYLLMLCERRLATYIPGKIYDYLSVNKPIIAFGHAGEVTDILSRLKAGIFIEESGFKTLKEILCKEVIICLDQYRIQAWLTNYNREKIADCFFNYLSENVK